jgi:hypothetical protein
MTTPRPLLERVEDMLNHFPLDGLRKAAQTFNLPTPSRKCPQEEQKKHLVAAMIEGLLDDSLGKNKAKVDTETMWESCKNESEPPVRISGDDELPLAMVVDMKRDIAMRITRIIEKLGGVDQIQAMCAGKVSSATKKAEKSGFCNRWRDRYGTPEYAYTGMRRLYVDESASDHYKAREALALEVEQHAFEVIRRLFGHRADGVVYFSNEAGRQSTGKTFGPQWKVAVYLAFKTKTPPPS